MGEWCTSSCRAIRAIRMTSAIHHLRYSASKTHSSMHRLRRFLLSSTTQDEPVASSTVIPPMTTSEHAPTELLGDAPAHQHSTQDPPNTVAPEAASESLDPQPITTQAQPHTEPGISSVAQFLPADAQLDHSTPPPSQPLVTDTNGAEQDISMTEAPLTSQAELPTSTSSAPALNGALAPSEAFLTAPQPHVDSSAMSDDPSVEPVKVEDTVLTPVSRLDDASGDVPVKEALGNDNVAPSVEVANEPQPDSKPSLMDADQQMQDPPSAGITRSREEDDDDDTRDEPLAKRPKVEPSADVPAEFKRPDLPSGTATTLSDTNGTITLAGTGTLANIPPRPTFSTAPLTLGQRKILEEKIKNTKKVKSAIHFLKPVDPIALNIPNYTNIIKNPMDISTMESKLKNDQYTSLDDFATDFELMVTNCFTFNGTAHAVSTQAQNLRAYFMKQMETVPVGDSAALPARPPPAPKTSPKPMPRRESRAAATPVVTPGAAPVAGVPRSPAPNDTFALLPGGTPMIRRDSTAGRPKRAVVPPAPRDLPYSGTKPKRKENQIGLKFCDHVLEELRKAKYDQMTIFFATPVDPVALNIPHYFNVIKTPMDIGTITNKLKNGHYSRPEEFKADFDLMFNNCFKFNPADNLVHTTGKTLQAEVDTLWKSKNSWISKNQPKSQRTSPVSDAESDAEESEEEDEDAGNDANEATIRALRDQVASMQDMLASISGAKRASPKVGGSKKKAKTGASGKSKKATVPAPKAAAAKAKSKKQRLVTYEEKQEISEGAENMNADQINKLTTIITENVAKYKVRIISDVCMLLQLTDVSEHVWRRC